MTWYVLQKTYGGAYGGDQWMDMRFFTSRSDAHAELMEWRKAREEGYGPNLSYRLIERTETVLD
jgi:hypothetical protein